MMPTLHRGDILFSTNSDVKIEVKDIVLAQVSKDLLMTPLWPLLLITMIMSKSDMNSIQITTASQIKKSQETHVMGHQKY